MDGDLYLLLLGLNMPNVHTMRRWNGLMVNDFEEIHHSKINPWDVGMVFVDIQVIREGIIYEMLSNFINNPSKFVELIK